MHCSKKALVSLTALVAIAMTTVSIAKADDHKGWHHNNNNGAKHHFWNRKHNNNGQHRWGHNHNNTGDHKRRMWHRDHH